MDTRDSRRPPAVERSSGFFFSLYYFSLQNKGIAATEIIFYMMHSLWTLVGRSLSRLLHRLDGETVTVLDQPVVEGWRARGVPWGGSAGFQDCSGKDCLKLKDFSRWGNGARAGDREFQVPSGTRMTKIKQTIFQHVYLDRDEDNIYVSHSLSWRVTLLLDGSIFL